MDSIRQQKINKLVQHELAEIFRSEAKNLFGGAFITVTVVRVSPDLGIAKVYISIMAAKDKAAVFELVKSQTAQIRKRLGLLVKNQLRVIPELHFYLDDSLDYAMKIDSLLKK